jgi:hypothetical protein
MELHPLAAFTMATIAESGRDAKPVCATGAESIYAARLKFNSGFVPAAICE